MDLQVIFLHVYVHVHTRAYQTCSPIQGIAFRIYAVWTLRQPVERAFGNDLMFQNLDKLNFTDVE